MEEKRKRFFWIYLLIIGIVSLYLNLLNVNVYFYFISVFVCILMFLIVYWLIVKFKDMKIVYRVFNILGICFCLLVVFVSFVFSSYSGFHSSDCYDIYGEDVFGRTAKYCNFPPWHIKITNFENTNIIMLLNQNVSQICLEKSSFTALNRYCFNVE